MKDTQNQKVQGNSYQSLFYYYLSGGLNRQLILVYPIYSLNKSDMSKQISYKMNTEASIDETPNTIDNAMENNLEITESQNIKSDTSKASNRKNKDRKSEALNFILAELQALREQVPQQTNEIGTLKGLLTTLTGEVVASRNEVRELKKMNIPVEHETIARKLPFSSVEDIRKFDLELQENSDMIEEFKRIIKRVGGADAASFARAAIKRVLTDELAIQFSWKGTKTKQSVEHMYFISLLREVCQQKFVTSDDSIIHHILQQHFVHAKDRLAKRKDRPDSDRR